MASWEVVKEIVDALHSLVDEKNVCWKYTPSERSICGQILELKKALKETEDG